MDPPGSEAPVFAEEAAAAMVERLSRQLRISPTLRALEPQALHMYILPRPWGTTCIYVYIHTHLHI